MPSPKHSVMGQNKSRNEMVAVQFIKTYCLPSMAYSCETWAINRSDIRTLDIAWNNAFRKTFNGFWRESVKPLLYYCSCLPISILLPMRKLLFGEKCFTVITCYWVCWLEAVKSQLLLLHMSITFLCLICYTWTAPVLRLFSGTILLLLHICNGVLVL